MIKLAIVVFREFLEIVFLLSIILTVTKPVQNSRKYIVLGLLSGCSAAALFAFFAKTISESLNGMGDELFDAYVILVTAILISWTAVWMQGYTKKYYQELSELSENITAGIVSCLMLVVVVATTIFRELVEIILFVYSVASAGKISGTQYITGVGIGVFGGVFIGALLYHRLIKYSSKKLFKILTILLIFIAAGLAAQSAGILTSVGIIEVLSDQLWDSSRLIDNSSIMGKILNIIIGYDARPNGMQVIFYVFTIIFTFIMMKLRELLSKNV